MGCEYCELIESKKNLLYEDDMIIAVVPDKPVIKGHIQVISKEHHDNMQDIDDKSFLHMIYGASFTATALFENLEAHGTNLIADTGSALKAGGHFHIDVIARKADDGLNYIWTPNKLPDNEMDEVMGKIKDKCDMIGVEGEEKKEVVLDKKPEKLESTEEKTSGKGVDGSASKEKVGNALPSEEEQTYNKDKGESDDKDIEEDCESYLIKQLKRLP